MQVVKNDKIVYPRGDGWEVLSECAYQSQKNNKIDQRLEQLLKLEK